MFFTFKGYTSLKIKFNMFVLDIMLALSIPIWVRHGPITGMGQREETSKSKKKNDSGLVTLFCGLDV